MLTTNSANDTTGSSATQYVWVVDSHYHHVPTLKRYVLVRLNPKSVTVLDGGKVVVIKEAGSRAWFTDQIKVKEHIRQVYQRLRADLGAELAAVNKAIAEDKFPGHKVSPDPRSLFDENVKLND